MDLSLSKRCRTELSVLLETTDILCQRDIGSMTLGVISFRCEPDVSAPYVQRTPHLNLLNILDFWEFNSCMLYIS